MNDVSFPGLGLEFEIQRYAFVIFNIEIYWYGIIIALAFLLAVLLAIRSCKKYDLLPDNILDLVLFAAPVAIVFARLFYVIFSWDSYSDDLIKILKIRDGGLAIYGGVIGALLVAWLYAKKKKISFFHLADFGIPYLVLGQGIGRWGNFVNQEAFGAPTALPWRMNGTIIDKYLAGAVQSVDFSKWGVHPTFLYESLWDITLFIFLSHYRKKKKVEGEVLFLYLILYGAGRAFIEGLRTDSLYIGTLRVSQVLSVLLLITGVAFFIYRRIKSSKAELAEPAELGQSRYGSLLMRMKQEEEEQLKAGVVNETREADSDETAAAVNNDNVSESDGETGAGADEQD